MLRRWTRRTALLAACALALAGAAIAQDAGEAARRAGGAWGLLVQPVPAAAAGARGGGSQRGVRRVWDSSPVGLESRTRVPWELPRRDLALLPAHLPASPAQQTLSAQPATAPP